MKLLYLILELFNEFKIYKWENKCTKKPLSDFKAKKWLIENNYLLSLVFMCNLYSCIKNKI